MSDEVLATQVAQLREALGFNNADDFERVLDHARMYAQDALDIDEVRQDNEELSDEVERLKVLVQELNDLLHPAPPHRTQHDHEAWQIRDDGCGIYCAACGEKNAKAWSAES